MIQNIFTLDEAKDYVIKTIKMYTLSSEKQLIQKLKPHADNHGCFMIGNDVLTVSQFVTVVTQECKEIGALYDNNKSKRFF